MCIPSFPTLMVYIQLERRALLALGYWSAGTDLVVLTFQLLLIRRLTVLFFLSLSFSFFYFVSVSFYRIFLYALFCFPPPPPTTFSAPDKRERPFVFLQTIRSTIPCSWLTQKVRAVLWSESLCTDWRFSVMETLAVILNCHSVWKENIVFLSKKTQTNKQ